jgi:malto-oligosyltrehalose trehalohydrolase
VTDRVNPAFGPVLLGDGRARFSLWAPLAAAEGEVSLVLPGRGERLPMRPAAGGPAGSGDGWLVTEAEAAPGEPYAFVLPDGREIADPASRRQAGDVHGPSVLTDPGAYAWRHPGWRGRPWGEAVVYELHLGTFSPAGTFEGTRARLPHLADLGVTAVELMPVADFAGRHGWGYDGVLPYAPARCYGTPDELKALVDEAHGLGMTVLLDVVYNHFGPEGNYLPLYAPFFTEDFGKTPWGAAIDFRRPEVREFFIGNALYWLTEFRFDGLRLDAVHAITDPSDEHVLVELGRRARDLAAREGRQIHLVLENERNQARFLRRGGDPSAAAAEEGRPYDAQWNDDAHHVLHVLLTGETAGYYEDFADRPAARLARVMASGFVYQGEPSAHAKGAMRGERSADLPALAFVDFLQNHDQIGNRALGERLAELVGERALQAAQSVLLLSPHVPLLFMGEEWGARTRFQYFCDFHGELAKAVSEGRKGEFAGFFANPDLEVPDPIDEATFARSKLDWDEPARPPHDRWLARTRALLRLRAERLAPRLAAGDTRSEGAEALGEHGLRAAWLLGDGSRLTLLACLGDSELEGVAAPAGSQMLHESVADVSEALAARGALPPWSAAWFLEEA